MGSSDRAAALEEIHAQVRRCQLCGLGRARARAVPGDGPVDSRIMFIGEGPGREEDEQGRPFVGAAGRLLTTLLRTIGLDRRDVFITNIVKCRPPGNRDPLPEEIEACRDYLVGQIALITPAVICTLGRFAAQSLINPQFAISRQHGKPTRISGILHYPLYHPAAALHQASLIDALEADMRELGDLLRRELPGGPARAQHA